MVTVRRVAQVAAAVSLVCSTAQMLSAAEIEVFWDKVKQKGAAGADAEKFVPVGPGPFKDSLDSYTPKLTEIDLDTRHDDPLKRWDFTGLPANAFTDFRKFGSVGNPLGAVHMNNSGKKITDLHIRLLNGDTFKDTSSGGNAFPDKEIKEGGKLLELSGGNIDKDEFLWSKIPKFAQGAAEGKLTDAAPKPKAKEVPKPMPKTGSSGTGMNFTPGGPPGTGSLTFTPSSIDTFQYRDGSSSKPGEVLAGATLTVDPTTITGPSSDVPGAFDVDDTTFNISRGDGTFLEGSLTDMLLYADGSQTTLQGTLIWDYYVGDQDSLILDDFYDPTNMTDRAFFLHSNLLALTPNLSLSEFVPGTAEITPVPEPALLAVAPLLLCAARRRRGSNDAR